MVRQTHKKTIHGKIMVFFYYFDFHFFFFINLVFEHENHAIGNHNCNAMGNYAANFVACTLYTGREKNGILVFCTLYMLLIYGMMMMVAKHNIHNFVEHIRWILDGGGDGVDDFS